jgi:hypothetical protein
LASLSHKEAIGWIGMERFWQLGGVYGNSRLKGQDFDGRDGKYQVEPFFAIHAEAQAAAFQQHCHLPAADCTYKKLLFLIGLIM